MKRDNSFLVPWGFMRMFSEFSRTSTPTDKVSPGDEYQLVVLFKLELPVDSLQLVKRPLPPSLRNPWLPAFYTHGGGGKSAGLASVMEVEWRVASRLFVPVVHCTVESKIPHV